MWITVNGRNETEINDAVMRRVLNLYPEEELQNRKVFKEAFVNGSISIEELKSESEKILIPWQMFLLNATNFNEQMSHIENQRRHKVSSKLVAKRKGRGEITSKRIIDRLIRQQNFLRSQYDFPINNFCGSLKGDRINIAAEKILKYFGIDRMKLWRYTSKNAALQYLIEQVETGNVNVSRGVLTNKILPTCKVVPSDVYRSTSGFVIRDESVPFVFLPSEINPDEVESRQIYTLVYLLVIIGLEQYEYLLDKNFSAKMLATSGMHRRLHAITSELLMPEIETEKLRGQNVTEAIRDELSSKFKVSPLALVTTLHMRDIISQPEYYALKPPPYVPAARSTSTRSPNISTSIAKFCGQISYRALTSAIRAGSLPSIQAQYLIFGSVNKNGYRKYLNEIGV